MWSARSTVQLNALTSERLYVIDTDALHAPVVPVACMSYLSHRSCIIQHLLTNVKSTVGTALRLVLTASAAAYVALIAGPAFIN